MDSPEKKKHQFLIGIEALKSQHSHDIEHAQVLSMLYNKAEIPVYNNGVLVNTMVKMLANFFDQPAKAEMAIQSYMYESSFGKHTGQTPKDLWELLWNSDWEKFFNS
jgi:hypothetical protein